VLLASVVLPHKRDAGAYIESIRSRLASISVGRLGARGRNRTVTPLSGPEIPNPEASGRPLIIDDLVTRHGRIMAVLK
jgi:hypothetical protein